MKLIFKIFKKVIELKREERRLKKEIETNRYHLKRSVHNLNQALGQEWIKPLLMNESDYVDMINKRFKNRFKEEKEQIKDAEHNLEKKEEQLNKLEKQLNKLEKQLNKREQEIDELQRKLNDQILRIASLHGVNNE